MKNEIILFENQSVKLEVNMKDETVWLTNIRVDKKSLIIWQMRLPDYTRRYKYDRN